MKVSLRKSPQLATRGKLLFEFSERVGVYTVWRGQTKIAKLVPYLGRFALVILSCTFAEIDAIVAKRKQIESTS